MEEGQEDTPQINPEVTKNLITGVQDWCKKALGVSPFESGFAENDWMLIVKLHAMIETALNAVIVSRLGTPELSDVIPRLETGNSKSGKAKIAKQLGLILPEEMVFIQKLSELRNRCVHDTRNFSFDLRAYLAERPDKDNIRSAFEKAVKRACDATLVYGPPMLNGAASIQQDLMNIGLTTISMLAMKNRAWEIRWGAHKWDSTHIVFATAQDQSTPTESSDIQSPDHQQ